MRLTILLITFSLFVSCTTPDHWSMSDVDWEDKLSRIDEGNIQPREKDQATWQDKPKLELPETGELAISVEQAAVLALSNNRDLRVQQLNPVIAGTFEAIERGEFDPELFAEVEYFKERSSQVNRATGTQFSVRGEDISATAGIRQELPTGTEIEASLGNDRAKSNRAPEQQVARAELSITQNLLRGFGPAVNMVSIKQAQLDVLRSEYELRRFAENLLAQTEVAYWEYAKAGRAIAIFEKSLAVAKQQRDEVEQRIEVGTRPKTEAAAARAEVSRRELDLIDARSDIEIARVELLHLLNPSDRDSFTRQVVAKTDVTADPQPITDLSDRLMLAQRMRPDLNEARLQLEQDRLEIIMTRNGLLPDLELFLSVAKTGFENSIEGSFDNFDRDTYDYTVGLTYTQQFGNRTAKAQHKAAQANRRQQALAIQNMSQLIEKDVRLQAAEVERTRQLIAATALTRQLQAETVEAERERFNVGTSTSLLVAQAQRDLVQAEIDEVEAIVDYRIALVNLYLAEGSLLERRGVSIGARQSLAGQ